MFESSLDALYPLVQAMGWALVHFCWQGALIAAGYAGGSLMLRKARPTTRYVFGLTSMAMMAAAPILTFWVVYPGSAAAPVESGAIAMLSTAVGVSSAQVGGLSAWFESALPWVVLLWAAGVVFMSGRVFVNWRRMKRLTRIGVLRLSAQLQDEVEKLSEMFGIRRAVTVLESTIVKVPTVLGWLKPVILLPSSTLLGLSSEQLELVIAHELGHIRRLDYLVNLLQVSIETALFYHPAVGWISRHVRDEREKCVDDLVIGHCGNPIEYARALADLESMRGGYQIAPAIGATDGQLLQRIERIVRDHTARPREAIAGNSILLLLLASVVVVAGQLADPMAELDGLSSKVAETLISGLVTESVPQGPDTGLMPLDSASVLSRPIQIETAELPIAEPQIVVSPLVEPRKDRIVNQRIVAVTPLPRGTTAEVAEAIPQSLPASPLAAKVELIVAAEPSMELAKPSFPASIIDVPGQSVHGVERVSKPSAITRVSPSYPVRARMAGQQGYVTVEFSIKGNGRVSDVRVIDSNPKRVFDNEARNTIRKWRFDPDTLARFGNKRFTQRFDFSLGGSQATQSDVTKGCSPITGTRICRNSSLTSLVSQQAYSS